MADKVTTMVIKADLKCKRCCEKIRKVLCQFPEVRDQIYDEKQNTVKITVITCCPERILKKIKSKGGKSVQKIEIPSGDKKKEEPAKVNPKEGGDKKKEEPKNAPKAKEGDDKKKKEGEKDAKGGDDKKKKEGEKDAKGGDDKKKDGGGDKPKNKEPEKKKEEHKLVREVPVSGYPSIFPPPVYPIQASYPAYYPQQVYGYGGHGHGHGHGPCHCNNCHGMPGYDPRGNYYANQYGYDGENEAQCTIM